MYDLHHLKGRTYYIDGPTNCGVYILNDDNECVLIDCGTALEGPIIETVLRRNKLKLKYLVNTHSHADHSGSNVYLMKMTGCTVIASKIERAFLRDSKLDIGFLYGGYPIDEFDTKLMHIDDQKEIYALEQLPEGLRSFKLPGHHYGQIGIRTSDGVYFIADSVVSTELVAKSHVVLIYDIQGYLDSLDYVEELKGNIIVPAHADVSTDLTETIEFSRNKIHEICDVIIDYLSKEHTAEEVTAHIFEHYNLRISYNKYMLIMATIRSYLSYLGHERKVKNYFKDNKLVFISMEAFEDKF
ncbi:MAG: MBL fold metallo-hydrolase [Acholeplasmatales bacterium]|nr:MBL fold metallo-hydrolase [Acholeplasmatales bacterium]